MPVKKYSCKDIASEQNLLLSTEGALPDTMSLYFAGIHIVEKTSIKCEWILYESYRNRQKSD